MKSIVRKTAMSLLVLGAVGVATNVVHAQGLSVSHGEKSTLDSFAGTDGNWIKVSEDIFASEHDGAKTVVYRNAAVKHYIAQLNRTIEVETKALTASPGQKGGAARADYIAALIDEVEQLQQEIGAADAIAKGIEVVEWDQGTSCGWILYAPAQFEFVENLVNGATVTTTFNTIGSGPQFAPPPFSLPIRFYRHVRSTIDPSSLGWPINDVATSRTNSAALQVVAQDINFWGDACVLTSVRTVSLKGGSCSATDQQMVAVTTRNCSDL
jgi:hypothetical protein